MNMTNIQILTMSPEGSMQFPEAVIRNLFPGGGKFAVITSRDRIVLKPLQTPSAQEFLSWMDDAQTWARDVGYREEDVDRIIKEVRGRS